MATSCTLLGITQDKYPHRQTPTAPSKFSFNISHSLQASNHSCLLLIHLAFTPDPPSIVGIQTIGTFSKLKGQLASSPSNLFNSLTLDSWSRHLNNTSIYLPHTGRFFALTLILDILFSNFAQLLNPCIITTPTSHCVRAEILFR